MPLNETQKKLCRDHNYDFSGLNALIINCTLKRGDRPSNTAALLDIPKNIMQENGVHVDCIRFADLTIPPNVQHDMTQEGYDTDDWPDIFNKVRKADILIIGTPIWLVEESSVCRRLIERLYAESAKTNDRGQYVFYGKAGGCVITGNEDGIKHCSMTLLYAMQHLGYTIPPQADAGWVGEAGPGPSYADDNSGGPENNFTQRNTTFMTWNLMHMAKILRDLGGFPAHGNQPKLWDDGCDFDHPNPEYR